MTRRIGPLPCQAEAGQYGSSLLGERSDGNGAMLREPRGKPATESVGPAKSVKERVMSFGSCAIFRHGSSCTIANEIAVCSSCRGQRGKLGAKTSASRVDGAAHRLRIPF